MAKDFFMKGESPDDGGQLIMQSPQRLARCSSARARERVPLELARTIGLLPLAVIEHQGRTIIAGAVAQDQSVAATNAIRFALGCESRLVEIPAETLEKAIVSAYKADGSALAVALASHTMDRDERAGSRKLVFLPRESETPRLLFELLEHAIAADASDLCLSPLVDRIDVKLKVHGAVCRWSGPTLHKPVYGRLVRAMKVLARLDPNLTTLPMDGAFDGPAGVRVRLSTLPTVHGENIVLRLIGGGPQLTLDELAFAAIHRERIERWLLAPSGLVVFAGATGAGKSSSLYGCMRELVRRGRGVASVEDPVEQVIVGVSQCQVHAALSFGQALRAVVRQAPDVIVIGEIRDSETALAALQAASTGHLVLCSIHGGDVREVISRCGYFGVTPEQLATGLRGIIVQRLVPRLCEQCRVPDLTTGGHRAVGCAACDHSGFNGRLLVCESYDHPRSDDLLRRQIQLSAPHHVARESEEEQLRREGWISLDSWAVGI